jgi:hypothetical protein
MQILNKLIIVLLIAGATPCNLSAQEEVSAQPFPDACFDDDCFGAHAFKWQRGFMNDLESLPGGGSSQGKLDQFERAHRRDLSKR